jgi:DNA-directed RNA polymerase
MMKNKVNLTGIESCLRVEDKIKFFFESSGLIAYYKGDSMVSSIFMLDNEYVLIYTEYLNNNFDIDKILNNAIKRSSIANMMNYLRDVRFDHAINYEIRDLIEPLLGELYKNKKIGIKDIISV